MPVQEGLAIADSDAAERLGMIDRDGRIIAKAGQPDRVTGALFFFDRRALRGIGRGGEDRHYQRLAFRDLAHLGAEAEPILRSDAVDPEIDTFGFSQVPGSTRS